jgi:hypothetical protein
MLQAKLDDHNGTAHTQTSAKGRKQGARAQGALLKPQGLQVKVQGQAQAPAHEAGGCRLQQAQAAAVSCCAQTCASHRPPTHPPGPAAARFVALRWLSGSWQQPADRRLLVLLATSLDYSTQRCHRHRRTPHATRHTPHATRHTPHATRHTPHATRHTPHATRHTPHATHTHPPPHTHTTHTHTQHTHTHTHTHAKVALVRGGGRRTRSSQHQHTTRHETRHDGRRTRTVPRWTAAAADIGGGAGVWHVSVCICVMCVCVYTPCLAPCVRLCVVSSAHTHTRQCSTRHTARPRR